MKIYIGPYKNWFGPYQLAEMLCFWVKKAPDEYGTMVYPEWVHEFGEFLAHGKNRPRDDSFSWRGDQDPPKTWLYKFLLWVDSKKKRKVKIHIDKYDTWNMDRTLALIVLPMLKQLKETKHGSPQVDMEDVPEAMRTTDTEEWDSQYTFDFYQEPDLQKIQCDIHDRWNWVLDEMIWAFEQHQPDVDWEEQYSTGVADYYSEPCEFDENGKPKLYEMKRGPNHTMVTDWDARQKHQDRINNGFRLFGKYFQALWD